MIWNISESESDEPTLRDDDKDSTTTDIEFINSFYSAKNKLKRLIELKKNSINFYF